MNVQQIVEIHKSLLAMRDCEGGMCFHCIDLLVERALPMVEQLAEGYGHCEAHGYVETSHRCARYDGESLRLTATGSDKEHNDGSSDIS